MTEIPIPSQPAAGGWDDPRNGRPPVHPSISTAGRLLCAGVYVDGGYRDRVIDELYIHEERIAAPSYGFDAGRVLAHALRARRAELGWAAGILGAWFVGALLTGGALLLLLIPFLAFRLAGWLRARGSVLLRFLALVIRFYAIAFLVLVLLGFLGTGIGMTALLADGPGGDGFLFGDDPYESSYGSYGSSETTVLAVGAGLFWGTAAVFAALVTLVAFQRSHVAKTIATDLSPQRYADQSADPAEAAPGARLARILRRIRREQWSPLVVYDINHPLCGAGDFFRPWQLSVELRPRTDLGLDRKPTPLDNSHILEKVVPRLQKLRVPSPHGSAAAEAAVMDRLRELVIEECVFVPATGLPHRDLAPVTAEAYAEHRAASVEEGGEQRRHFLRVRVGGWDENLVVTVFVRVHTQGGMLMLEVAPHVLLPLPVHFLNADADAQRYLNNHWFGKAVWALVHSPRSFTAAVLTLSRGLASWWRIVTGGHGGARPEGAWASVREIASQDNGSIFHLMDLDRYLKTIQDRVVAGVTEALHEAGWHTEEFAQRAVNVAEGGVFIQSVNQSAFAVGGSGHTNNVNQSAKGSSGGK
ncbi:hypothetical protein DEJ50_19985 [Streptomyces venezuelae]|uniref:Uncharacterized protein n=1 Tax=Streptomyces venezuelae TaxID=54571 RepID=A0A5P2D4U1_STRVZ|nr:hypothetical protein [Streptomyces venezuelae]QES49753.1 hypothetical protein DEJ50_19985 [Streptomyces venezuelae]